MSTPTAIENSEGVRNAWEEWRRVLPPERMFNSGEAQETYGPSTSPARIRLGGALKPLNDGEIRSILRTAQSFGVRVYPISTGRNWGYGTALPSADGCVILDLSGMNGIRDFDEEMGTVTVEPGVTQGQLRQFLDERRAKFLVPVHGGGPTCSLMGNALERGMGITPHADHFAAVTALEAVLPTGEMYRPALSDLGGTEIDKIFKWGIGPYLNGIFTQGNFGVVTAVTITLCRQPERIEAFHFWVEDDRLFEETVRRVRNVFRALGPIVGAINLMDQRRMVALSVPYPFDRVPKGSAMPDELVAELGRKSSMPRWMGAGALYGTKEVVKAARALVKKELGPVCRRMVFLRPETARRAIRWMSMVPPLRQTQLFRSVYTLTEIFKILEGVPSEIALKTPYWKINRPQKGPHPDPARDGCGLLWYAPLVPMKPGAAATYIAMVRRVMIKHGFDPIITLIGMSERCFDSPIPLLFDAREAEESERAKKCFAELFDEGKKNGFLPYRIGAQNMPHVVNAESTFWKLASKIKQAVDPAGILAPGRYNLTTNERG